MADKDMTDFTLAPALANASHHIMDWPLCQLRLHDDARYLWLVLVPHVRAGLTELTDLSTGEQQILMGEIIRASDIVRSLSGCDKINIGALGNVEPQLHIHVLGRTTGDPAWPGPVWGHSAGAPYTKAARHALMTRIKTSASHF